MSSSPIKAQLFVTDAYLYGDANDDEVNTMSFNEQTYEVFAAGYFQNSFDGTINALGGKDAFVLKHDPFGTPWFVQIGSAADEEITASSFDVSTGSLYVAGTFSGSTLSVGSNTLNNAGNTDVFIAKINAMGNIVWSMRMGGSGSDYISAIKTDSSGNIYACGYFFGGSFTAGPYTLGGGGLSSSYLVKINNTGLVDWAKEAKGSGGGVAIARDVSISTNGTIWMVGEFSVAADFVVSTLNAVGTRDGFSAAYNSSGTFQYATQYFGNSGAQVFIRGIRPIANHEMVMAGYFSQDIFEGSAFINSAGNMDMMILQINNFGTILNGFTAGGPGDDRILGMGGDFSNVFSLGYESDLSEIQGVFLQMPLGVSKSGLIINTNHNTGSPMVVTGRLRLAEHGISAPESVFKTTYDGLPLFVSPFSGYSTGNINSTIAHGGKDAMICDVLMFGGVEESERNSFRASPNPVRDNLNILFTKPIKDRVQVRIYDAMGHHVLSDELSIDDHSIDLQSLRKGVYCITLFENGTSQAQKIIKQ